MTLLTLKKKRIINLLSKLAEKKDVYTRKELNFVMKYANRKNYKIRYVFYRKKSEKPIGYIIDSMANCPRKSGFENIVDTIVVRDPTDEEWKAICQNFGCNNRRFTCYWYKSIIGLIEDDKNNNVETPKNFVQECLDRGFNNGFQTKINLE